MATFAARRLGEIADNVRGDRRDRADRRGAGLEFRRPLCVLAGARGGARDRSGTRVARYDEDRRFAEDIAAVKAMIAEGAFTRFAGPILPSRGG